MPVNMDYITVGSNGPSHPSTPLGGDAEVGIHTSDRALFRRCRRKWFFASPLHQHLTSNGETYGPLWFGTGMHGAMEDFHGYNHFGHPAEALKAYVDSFGGEGKPPEWEELLDLGISMSHYYNDHWLKRRNIFRTVKINGVPQVEVKFRIPIPTPHRQNVYFVGTFDRISPEVCSADQVLAMLGAVNTELSEPADDDTLS